MTLDEFARKLLIGIRDLRVQLVEEEYYYGEDEEKQDKLDDIDAQYYQDLRTIMYLQDKPWNKSMYVVEGNNT